MLKTKSPQPFHMFWYLKLHVINQGFKFSLHEIQCWGVLSYVGYIKSKSTCNKILGVKQYENYESYTTTYSC